MDLHNFGQFELVCRIANALLDVNADSLIRILPVGMAWNFIAVMQPKIHDVVLLESQRLVSVVVTCFHFGQWWTACSVWFVVG